MAYLAEGCPNLGNQGEQLLQREGHSQHGCSQRMHARRLNFVLQEPVIQRNVAVLAVQVGERYIVVKNAVS